jgi:hypothetical protein
MSARQPAAANHEISTRKHLFGFESTQAVGLADWEEAVKGPPVSLLRNLPYNCVAMTDSELKRFWNAIQAAPPVVPAPPEFEAGGDAITACFSR